MTSLQLKTETKPLTVNFPDAMPKMTMTTEQFYDFCQVNLELRIERTAKGEVVVMPPAFSGTGSRNFEIAVELGIWARQDGTGKGFDSSTGFTLPNGATRSPDAAWIQLQRWNQLSEDQKASFAPVCPDFVIELRSASDTLNKLQDKMEEYIENGVQLGLLIDRKNRQVHIYRPDSEPQILDSPTSAVCEPELPKFKLPMQGIW